MDFSNRPRHTKRALTRSQKESAGGYSVTIKEQNHFVLQARNEEPRWTWHRAGLSASNECQWKDKTAICLQGISQEKSHERAVKVSSFCGRQDALRQESSYSPCYPTALKEAVVVALKRILQEGSNAGDLIGEYAFARENKGANNLTSKNDLLTLDERQAFQLESSLAEEQSIETSSCKSFAPVGVNFLHDGQRIEYFENGSQILKDVLGRVVEVKSQTGEALFFQYDSSGNLDSFVRFNAIGKAHSFGRREKHAVVVRDTKGRVQAVGEIMTVDPWGCMYLHNSKGQFISLDMARNLHMERRLVMGMNGLSNTITAVFAYDGFRMGTWLYRATQAKNRARLEELNYCIRFYGRDGSLVEFGSEEDLRRHRPTRVLRPGSLFIDPCWRQQRQAGTAWGAVHEYLAVVS